MHRKYTTMKKHISMYNSHRPVDRDPSNPDFQTLATKFAHDPERSKERMRKQTEESKNTRLADDTSDQERVLDILATTAVIGSLRN